MEARTLSGAEKTGVRAVILSILCVLVLFVLLLVIGQPIHYFGSKALSVTYVVVIYVPVVLLCVFAYRRISRA